MRATAVLLAISILAAAGVRAGSDAPLEEDPLALNPEMIAFLDENFPRTLSPFDRMRRLVTLVFNDNVLGFTYGAETRTAIGTFEGRTGNCLSFTSMFIAMARHLGLNARFREAETVPIWNQRGQVFTVSQHINVAVDMGSRWFLVDLYPEVGEMEIGGQVVSDERGLAHFYNNRAVDRLSEGHVEQAAAYLRRALELDAEAPFLWTNMGVVLNRRGDPEGAEAAYRQALKLARAHLPAVSNLATLYAQQGKLDLARRYRSKAAKFRNRNPYYHYHLGNQAQASGEIGEALRHFRKAVKLKREEHRFHFALARVHTRLGKTDQALEHLEAAGRYAPDESGRLRYHQKQRLLLAERDRRTVAGRLP